MQKLELSSVDVGNVVKKLMNKFVNNTLEVDELYYSKNFKRYADDCVAQEFYRKMRRLFMNSRVHIDKFLRKQLEIIRWLEIKQCTKNKCSQWLSKRMGVVENCPKCSIKKEEKKKKMRVCNLLKPIVCCEMNTCSMCLDDMNEGDEVSKLVCGHSFHPICIENWLLKYSKEQCPNCRTDVIKNNNVKKCDSFTLLSIF
jgi:hypothetical protein